MFELILQNILNRYTTDELIKKYNLELPDNSNKDELYAQINLDGAKVKGKYGTDINVKNLDKKIILKLSKADLFTFADKKALAIKSHETILARLMRKFKEWKANIIEKLKAALFGKSKALNILFNIILALLGFVFIVIEAVIQIFKIILNPRGNIINAIFAIVLKIISLLIGVLFKLISTLIGLLLTPILNKIVDALMDKSFVKQMIEGYFFANSVYFKNGILIFDEADLAKSQVNIKKGKANIIMANGQRKFSLIDNLKSSILPYYIKNTAVIIEVSEKDLAKLNM